MDENQPTPPCRWCGETHGPRCPNVKALEYGIADPVRGTVYVSRIEFFSPVERGEVPRHSDVAVDDYRKLKPREGQ